MISFTLGGGTGTTRTLCLSGQSASDADSAPLHTGDLTAEYSSAWACLLDALASAGVAASNLASLNSYITHVPDFMEAAEAITKHHIEADATIVSTLFGVLALYHPDVLIEIEGTALA